jgi:hypothetical protein
MDEKKKSTSTEKKTKAYDQMLTLDCIILFLSFIKLTGIHKWNWNSQVDNYYKRNSPYTQAPYQSQREGYDWLARTPLPNVGSVDLRYCGNPGKLPTEPTEPRAPKKSRVVGGDARVDPA